VLQTRNEGNPSDGCSSEKQALDAGEKEEQGTELYTILNLIVKPTELPASSVTNAAILALSLSLSYGSQVRDRQKACAH
jgi:hypothetical protein